MSEPPIQLWTDDSNSEFAIFSNSNYMIRTNANVNYTKLVDESVCMQGYNYDWKHTLSQWVNFHFGNQLNLPDNLDVSNFQRVSSGVQEKRKTERVRIPRPHNLHRETERISKLERKSKPKLLKCTFCNLKFCINEERDDHEKFWHNNKLATK
jgi:hypothetical protein